MIIFAACNFQACCTIIKNNYASVTCPRMPNKPISTRPVRLISGIYKLSSADMTESSNQTWRAEVERQIEVNKFKSRIFSRNDFSVLFKVRISISSSLDALKWCFLSWACKSEHVVQKVEGNWPFNNNTIYSFI